MIFLIFLIVFLMLFPSAMYKKSKLCVILFKGLRLLFLQNVPGVTFIQVATSILDSRVGTFLQIEAYACNTEFQGLVTFVIQNWKELMSHMYT